MEKKEKWSKDAPRIHYQIRFQRFEYTIYNVFQRLSNFFFKEKVGYDIFLPIRKRSLYEERSTDNWRQNLQKIKLSMKPADYERVDKLPMGQR